MEFDYFEELLKMYVGTYESLDIGTNSYSSKHVIDMLNHLLEVYTREKKENVK